MTARLSWVRSSTVAAACTNDHLALFGAEQSTHLASAALPTRGREIHRLVITSPPGVATFLGTPIVPPIVSPDKRQILSAALPGRLSFGEERLYTLTKVGRLVAQLDNVGVSFGGEQGGFDSAHRTPAS